MKSKKSRERERERKRWERGKKILHPYRLDICYQTRLFYQWTLFNTGFLRPAGNECQRLFVYRPMPRSPCRLRLSLSSPGTHDIPNPLVFRPRSTESSRVTHRGSPRGRKRRGARNQGEGGGERMGDSRDFWNGAETRRRRSFLSVQFTRLIENIRGASRDDPTIFDTKAIYDHAWLRQRSRLNFNDWRIKLFR